MFIAWAGILAGAAHVLAGPDHLAAVAPLTVQSKKSRVFIGLTWGIGHAIGIGSIGILIWYLKARFDFASISSLAESLVGFLLIGIGVRALLTANHVVVHKHEHLHETDNGAHRHAHLHVHVGQTQHPHPKPMRTHRHEPVFIGFLHGIAGTGHLFGLLPALALGTNDTLIYLCSYLIASIMMMIGFTYVMGQVFQYCSPKLLPLCVRTVALVTISVGLYWLAQIPVDGAYLG